MIDKIYFFDKQDYQKFMKEILRTKELYSYELYACCLMNNHVHLIIYDKENQLSKIDQYSWSSYREYFYDVKMIERKKICSLFGETKKDQINNYTIFHQEEEKINDEVEYEMIENLQDKELKEKIQKVLEVGQIEEIRNLNPKIRNEKLRKLKVIQGTTKLQLARVLGISRKILERAMR